MVEFAAKKPVILVVEDDPHGLDFMVSSIELSGFEVHMAESAERACKLCEKNGLATYSAVISDYRLPQKNGIDLVQWIRSIDESLSTVIITGQGEKSIVEKSLSVGVFEYLEKPVTHQKLRQIINKAVERTAQKRKEAEDREGLEALGILGESLNVVVSESLQKQTRVFYRPLHQVGGDFIITHEFDDGRIVLLLGDVSGHDIPSGYVSSYFQGMFKGCLGSGGQMEQAFRITNKSLVDRALQKGSLDDLISLSLSAVEIDTNKHTVNHWNFGQTPCSVTSSEGRIRTYGIGHSPLGWMAEIDTEPTRFKIHGGHVLYIFTDGVVEYAEKIDVNPYCLLYRFFHNINGFPDLPVLQSDDILAVRFCILPTMPTDPSFEPLLSEHYAGTEVDHIDHLQSNWRRSLSFALDDRLGDRLYDLLICIREGMLNALIHGCERSPEKFAHLQISINREKDLLRVHIDDPGRGHEFDLKARLDKINIEMGDNLGLGIIQHLSDEFQVENQGTSLVFDFQVTPTKV